MVSPEARGTAVSSLPGFFPEAAALPDETLPKDHLQAPPVLDQQCPAEGAHSEAAPLLPHPATSRGCLRNKLICCLDLQMWLPSGPPRQASSILDKVPNMSIIMSWRDSRLASTLVHISPRSPLSVVYKAILLSFVPMPLTPLAVNQDWNFCRSSLNDDCSAACDEWILIHSLRCPLGAARRIGTGLQRFLTELQLDRPSSLCCH